MRETSKWRVEDGNPLVPGATPVPGGVNYTANVPLGAEVDLVLVGADGGELFRARLSERQRVGDAVSVRVLGQGVRRLGYYYVVDGKRTIDLYAKRIAGETCFVEGSFDGKARPLPHFLERKEQAPDQPLDQPLDDMMIYRLHVRGYTKDPRSGVREKGTFRGLVRKIPYIKSLGFTAVELMPAYEWDDSLHEPPLLPNGQVPHPPLREPKRNFWGYAKKNYYFAPKEAFAWTKNAVQEVRDLIRALHAAGLSCIMEFYAPTGVDPAFFQAALRHWRLFYHVDGFHLVGEGVPRDAVLADPVLADTKLFFADVDLGLSRSRRTVAAYRLDFLYGMRPFLRGDKGHFHDAMRFLVENGYSVGTANFMALTEGFTLRDMVSYNEKHNEANGAGNFDGIAENLSWNCGEEGPSKEEDVLNLRARQMKNALAYVFFSQGIPVLSAGDELGNSQQGNNYAFAQDNPLGWVNWGEEKQYAWLQDFVRTLTAFRKEHAVLHGTKPLRATDYLGLGLPDVSFHDTHVWYAPFDEECRSVGMLLSGAYAKQEDGSQAADVFVALNAHWEWHSFEIPEPGALREWVRVLDTAPEDAKDLYLLDEEGAPSDQRHLVVPARSVTVLVSRPCSEEKVRAKQNAIAYRQEAERRRVRERMEQGRRATMMRRLAEAGCDVDRALERVLGDTAFYEELIEEFLQDPTFGTLEEAMQTANGDAAFEAAHTLKGAAMSLGLRPIGIPVAKLTEALRAKKTVGEEAQEHLQKTMEGLAIVRRAFEGEDRAGSKRG